MIRLIASLFTQELARPRREARHARRDFTKDMAVPATLGVPTWPSIAAETARDDLDRTLRAWHHGFASEGSLHGATTTWIEATR